MKQPAKIFTAAWAEALADDITGDGCVLPAGCLECNRLSRKYTITTTRYLRLFIEQSGEHDPASLVGLGPMLDRASERLQRVRQAMREHAHAHSAA